MRMEGCSFFFAIASTCDISYSSYVICSGMRGRDRQLICLLAGGEIGPVCFEIEPFRWKGERDARPWYKAVSPVKLKKIILNWYEM